MARHYKCLWVCLSSIHLFIHLSGTSDVLTSLKMLSDHYMEGQQWRGKKGGGVGGLWVVAVIYFVTRECYDMIWLF